jgi:hypothetical protein
MDEKMSSSSAAKASHLTRAIFQARFTDILTVLNYEL